MEVVAVRAVREFIDALDTPVRADVRRLVFLLEQYGHELPMLYTKPIGRGLWELRRTGRPQIRILYGVRNGVAVLVVAVKKQRSTLQQKDIELAKKRLSHYCD